jgi:hypothetical protein
MEPVSESRMAEVRRYPIHHFDIYLEEDFEGSVRGQVEFLKSHL